MRRWSLISLVALPLALVPRASLAQPSPATATDPSPERATSATTRPTPPRATASPTQPEGTILRLHLPGDLQLRYHALSDQPLAVAPGAEGTWPANLGQNAYFEHWLRFSPELSIGSRFRVRTQFDVARGIVTDTYTSHVGFSREPRDEALQYGLVDVRWVYAEWDSPVGVFRVGQQGFTSGLGILANDGARMPLFGDYHQGDIVERVAFATRPAGRDSDVVVALAGDAVYRDRVASLADGDVALQAVASVYYQPHTCRTDCERRRIGGYVGYRDIDYDQGGFLRVLLADLYARWTWPQPGGTGRVFAGIELAGLFGATDVARTQTHDEHRILQFGAAGELGLERDGRYRVALEGGYASGDSNPLDGDQRRMTLNPSHRVGLVLFPEVIAWETARSAAIASATELVGRPARGSSFLPSSGGVTGAAYLYPNARVNLTTGLDLRGAVLIAVATADWVDPASVQLYGEPRNFRGGDASRRDLGVELDLGVQGTHQLTPGVTFTLGVQGGVLFPGRAFDDASGRAMPPVGTVIGRTGLTF